VSADELVDLLGDALDEICRLRRALAYEARVVEAHYEGYKTFPKSRRRIAEEQVARMREGVMHSARAYAGTSWSSLERESRACGFEFLTRASWQREVGR
jgi:hypothetical protein